MKITFLPQTYLGKWSVRLAGSFIILSVLAQIVEAVGRNQGAFEPKVSSFYAILFSGTIIPVGVAGIAALLTRLISMIKFKERSLLIYVAILIGFFVLIFVLGEFLFPH